MGRGKAAHRAGRKNGSTQGTNSCSKSAFKAAEQSQQRGERRSGPDAIPHLQEAVNKYRECMSQNPDAEMLMNAQVLCSESLQLLAKATLASEEQLPDIQQSIHIEREARQTALELYAEAVQVAKQSKSASTGQWLRADAAVNCGNCLSEAAEVSPSEQQVALLVEAVSCYEAALSLEPDAITWSNLADVLIQLAQALAASKRLQDAEQAVARARSAYQSSCSNSSSYDGDDLPGLLCNWGTGLAAVAGMLREGGAVESSVDVAQEAVMRIKCSLDLQPTDVQVHIALAEAYSGLAEALADVVAQCQHAADATAPPASSTWQEAGTWQEAVTAALTSSDSALSIDRGHTHALVVKAEVHALHAKLLRNLYVNHLSDAHRAGAASGSPHGGAGEGPIACSSSTYCMHWKRSVECFEKVLEAPQKLGSCSERCTVRYNCACALAMAGRVQEALRLLRWVAEKNHEALGGADTDLQLRGLWETQEFKALVATMVK